MQHNFFIILIKINLKILLKDLDLVLILRIFFIFLIYFLKLINLQIY